MNEYISREAMVKGLNADLARHAGEGEPLTHLIIRRFIKCIEDFPAADVQPVRHGRWSECYTDTHHYSGICSVCGKASIKSLAESLYAFCPKCGARMIKGGDKK